MDYSIASSDAVYVYSSVVSGVDGYDSGRAYRISSSDDVVSSVSMVGSDASGNYASVSNDDSASRGVDS